MRKRKWSLVKPNIEGSWVECVSHFPVCVLNTPFLAISFGTAEYYHRPGKFREAEGEQWGVFYTIKYSHSYSTWLTDIKRLLCEIHHTAQDCSKPNLSDKCLKLIIHLPPFFLWRHWSSCVDRAMMKYQGLGNAELALNLPLFEHKATAWETSVIFFCINCPLQF